MGIDVCLALKFMNYWFKEKKQKHLPNITTNFFVVLTNEMTLNSSKNENSFLRIKDKNEILQIYLLRIFITSILYTEEKMYVMYL